MDQNRSLGEALDNILHGPLKMALQLREGGMPYRAIAAVLGVSPSTVRRRIEKAAGGPVVDRVQGNDGKTYAGTAVPSGFVRVPSEKMIEMREAGASYRAIAAETGVSHQTVMRRFGNLPRVL